MPLHLLTEEESDLYDQDESNIEGIEVAGVDGNGFLMWIYFDQINKDELQCNNCGWTGYFQNDYDSEKNWDEKRITYEN